MAPGIVWSLPELTPAEPAPVLVPTVPDESSPPARTGRRASLMRKVTPLGICAASLTEAPGASDWSPAGNVASSAGAAFGPTAGPATGAASAAAGAAGGGLPAVEPPSYRAAAWPDGLAGKAAGLPPAGRRPIMPRGRIITVHGFNSSDPFCEDSAVWSCEQPASAFTSTSSAAGVSRRSPVSSTWSTDAPSARTPDTAPRSRKRPFGKMVPGWTLRYCEFVGHSVMGTRVQKEPSVTAPALDALAVKALAKAPVVTPRRQNTRRVSITEDDESGGEGDSAFLATRGYDRRVLRIQEKDGRLPRESRLVARRKAIVSEMGHVRLQAGLATRMMCIRRPDHMRRLMRVCESKTNKLQTLRTDSKDLSSEQLGELTGRKGLTDQEVRDLFSVFNHYDFDESGFLDSTEIRNVLEDLGLQPRTREEKVEVNEILCDHDLEGLHNFSFNEFLTMVKAIRTRLRQIQQAECMHLFDLADETGEHSLPLNKVLQLLEDRLDLKFRTEDERVDAIAIFGQSDADGDGRLEFEEFQSFVQRVRVKLLMARRDEERTIAKAFRLQADLVADFRGELPLLWDIFTRYYHSGTKYLAHADLAAFFVDIGIVPCDQESDQAKVVATVIDLYGRPENDFPWVLTMIRSARRHCIRWMEDDLRMKFHIFDRDGDGMLSMPEVYSVLEEFKMLPRTREEQQEISLVINRLDKDGSGNFDFEEFEGLMQRMTEQVRLAEREREHKVGLELGFSDEQLVALRKIFLQLGPDQADKVGRHQLLNSFPIIRGELDLGPVDEQRFMGFLRTVQTSPDRALDYVELLRSVRGAAQAAVVEERSTNAATADRDAGEKPPGEFRKTQAS